MITTIIRRERICGGRNMDKVNAAFSERMAFITNEGRREANEDGLLVMDGARRVLAVADGLGGHYGGEVASQTALTVLEREIRSGTSLNKSFERAHQGVKRIQKAERVLSKMRTTLSAAEIFADHVEAVSCGDSFIFLAGNGKMGMLNLPHTTAGNIYKRGNPGLVFPHYDYKGFKKHMANTLWEFPKYNTLSSCIGTKNKIKLYSGSYPLHAGDRLFLCTDGLTDYLPSAKIIYALTKMKKSSLETIVSALYTHAIASMDWFIPLGYEGDNITMVLYEHGRVADTDDKTTLPPKRSSDNVLLKAIRFCMKFFKPQP